MNRRFGFTLVEMSIVLVIIALIVGGIFVGRDLIEGSKIRAQISQIQRYQTAVKTFQVKYNAVPGDMTGDQAAAVGFVTTAANRPGDLINHEIHGDGFLEDGTTWALNRVNYEPVLFWRDLVSANLIEGDYSKATDGYGVAANLDTSTLGNFLPAAVLGNGTYVVAYGLPVSWNWGLVTTQPGNFFQLVGLLGTDAGARPNVFNPLTPLQAQAIDSKIDDGVFYTGQVMSSDFYYMPSHGLTQSVYPFNMVTNGPFNNNAGLCASQAAGYSVKLDPDASVCQLSFRM